MKTEIQIAKENIKTSERYKDKVVAGFAPHMVCKTHKASCERFLEFLENMNKKILKKLKGTARIFDAIDSPKLQKVFDKEIKKDPKPIGILEKITDLKQAIKLYNEAGI